MTFKCSDIYNQISAITAEIARLRETIQSENERFERTRDGLEERLSKTENELTVALQNEKTAHEEDVERLTREKVRLSL